MDSNQRVNDIKSPGLGLFNIGDRVTSPKLKSLSVKIGKFIKISIDISMLFLLEDSFCGLISAVPSKSNISNNLTKSFIFTIPTNSTWISWEDWTNLNFSTSSTSSTNSTNPAILNSSANLTTFLATEQLYNHCCLSVCLSVTLFKS